MDYLRIPFPARGTQVNQLVFLAVDLETTGLDPQRDEILSIGHVPIRHLGIPLRDSACAQRCAGRCGAAVGADRLRRRRGAGAAKGSVELRTGGSGTGSGILPQLGAFPFFRPRKERYNRMLSGDYCMG